MGQNDKVVSALSYILVGIIWYFVDKKAQNTKTKFHVKQALNLLIISFIAGFVISILSTIIGIVTFGLGLILVVPIALLIQVGLFILWIIGLINAINLNQKDIPVIGGFASKYLTF
ncbi:MAG: DUF4870 domain-containing protein [Candidatus Woesearchaeota archaeon]